MVSLINPLIIILIHNIEVDPNVPLIGLTGVWNKDKDNQGLQIKVGNTYQSNDTDITRAIVGATKFSETCQGGHYS